MKNLKKIAIEKGWIYVLKNYNLSADEISLFSSNFTNECWQFISENDPSINIIREFKDNLNWITITDSYSNLNDDFVEEFKDYIDWDTIPTNLKISEYIIDKYSNRIDWEKLYNQYRNIENYYIIDNESNKRTLKLINKYYRR